MKTLLAVLVAVSLAGCSSTGSYDRYIEAQSSANSAAIKAQKPMVRIIAEPGKSITGLASIEVYGPMTLPQVQQERPSEWAAVAQSALGVLGIVGGVIASGNASVDLANAVGASAGQGYKYIQAAPTVTTTTTTTTSTNTDNSVNNPVTTTDSNNPVTNPTIGLPDYVPSPVTSGVDFGPTAP